MEDKQNQLSHFLFRVLCFPLFNTIGKVLLPSVVKRGTSERHNISLAGGIRMDSGGLRFHCIGTLLTIGLLLLQAIMIILTGLQLKPLFLKLFKSLVYLVPL
ncbi:hypothetical protein DL96DRAFT_1636658 [Flagelloscypha sp. PMI_526]|nr:hypothetical protein DL96DRAFT_1636658 [Flagelloscypha sp. PMI_526]